MYRVFGLRVFGVSGLEFGVQGWPCGLQGLRGFEVSGFNPPPPPPPNHSSLGRNP